MIPNGFWDILDEYKSNKNQINNLEQKNNAINKKLFLIKKKKKEELPFDYKLYLIISPANFNYLNNISATKTNNLRLFNYKIPGDLFENYNNNGKSTILAGFYDNKYRIGFEFNSISINDRSEGSYILSNTQPIFNVNQNLKVNKQILSFYKLWKIYHSNLFGFNIGIISQSGSTNISSDNFIKKSYSLKERYNGVGVEFGLKYKTRLTDNLYLNLGYNIFSTRNDFRSRFNFKDSNDIFNIQLIGQNSEFEQFNYSGKNNYHIVGDRSTIIFDYTLNENYGLSFGIQAFNRIHKLNNYNPSIIFSNLLNSELTIDKKLEDFIFYNQFNQSKNYTDYISQIFLGGFLIY